MFVFDFLHETPFLYYWALVFSLIFFSYLIGLKYFMGPTAFSAFYFLSASIWSLFHLNGWYFFSVFTFILIFLFSFWLGVNSKLIFRIRKVNAIKLSKFIYLVFVVLYICLIFYIVSKFGVGGKVDKLSWTLNSGGLHYLFAGVSLILIVVSFHLLQCGNPSYFYLALVVSFVVGIVFGMKGAAISFLMFYMAELARKNMFNRILSLKTLKFFFFFMIFVFVLVLVNFGSGLQAGGLSFLTRLTASIDGTFVIIQQKMYLNYELPHSPFYYIFDVVTSRFFGVSQSVGQQIAQYSPIPYPEFGGPNDSIVNYYLLSNELEQVSLAFLLFFISFFAGVMEQLFKGQHLAQASLTTKLLVYPAYLMIPNLYQGTGTAILLFAREFVVIIPLVLILYVLKKVSR